MGWRLHLTNRAIQSLEILDGPEPLLVAWSRRDRVAFYDLESGTPLEERTLRPAPTDPRQGTEWQSFVSSLTAPNGAVLPVVRTAVATIYTTDDGRLRLYLVSGKQLFLETDGTEVPLDTAGVDEFQALALDRFLGLAAALAEDGRLHLYQQQIHVGAFDLGLSLEVDLVPSVAVSRGGGSIFVSDGKRLVLTDSSGRARKTLETHYFISKMTCSPNGRFVLTSDLEAGVLRIYSGSDLTLLRQRFAIDLIVTARQVQLMADLPPMTVAPSAVALDNRGSVAFAMSGIICVSGMTEMDELPRPQALL